MADEMGKEEKVAGEPEEKDEKIKLQETLRTLDKPLERMTVKDLRNLGKEIPGVQGVHAMKKDEIISALYDYMESVGNEVERPAKAPKTKSPGVVLSKPELKKKAAALRSEKEALRAGGDMRKVRVMRRRINRLKKMTRRSAA